MSRSRKLRLARRGRPPTRPLGRARWPNQRTIFPAIVLIDFSYVSPMANSFGASACYAGNQQRPTCCDDSGIFPLTLGNGTVSLIIEARREFNLLRRSFCAPTSRISGHTLRGLGPNPRACVFLWTQVDDCLSTITGQCSRSSCRPRSKLCSRPSGMGYARSGSFLM